MQGRRRRCRRFGTVQEETRSWRDRSIWLGNGAWNRLDAPSAAEFEANAIDIGHIETMVLHGCEQSQLSQVGGEPVNALIAEIFGEAFSQAWNILWYGSERFVQDKLKEILNERN